MPDSTRPTADPHNPVPYPGTRREIAQTFKQPLGRIWLRLVARVMEWLTDLLPTQLNYSDITPQIAVGGSFRNSQIRLLRERGVTAVVDCREEAQDDPVALSKAGIRLLHLPAPDRHALTFEQLSAGVEWVLDHLDQGGRAFLHCEHGVGRGPLMASAVLVAQGYTAPDALQLVRTSRWQAAPNDRQLRALLAFERAWRRREAERRAHTAS